MKNYIKLLIAIAAVGFVSCEADFENAVTDEGFYSSGTANFSNYVALGNSLTSGYADGGLYITGQNNSYPNIMAGQFALVGGGEFTQPLMSDNIGGLLLGGVQITSNRFVLGVDANGNPGPVRLEGTPTTDVLTSAPGPYNNMGVVGAKSFHLSAPGYGNAAGILSGAANPYYARIATSASSTVLEDALSLDATFFSLWIGNNDVLSYATSGGSGVDQTGNLDLSTYGSNDITDPNVFGAVYSAQVAALVAGGAKGVLINIPDVSSIPYFTTVPGPAIPLDAATASAVNAQFAAYNTQILPGLAGLGIITPEEADSRIVSFSAGQNYPIITDNDLTDMSGILQGQPFNLPPATAGLLGQLRQANSGDLTLLTAASVLGSTPDPSNPQLVVGVSIPVSNEYILTSSEQSKIATATAAYNVTINALASANDLAIWDSNSAFDVISSS
ncbi:G-D-S-L family lipolytic protein [Ulvibacter sp.]|nr:G-D-S-L family lipolytic protein [Ulvibacter sp.]